MTPDPTRPVVRRRSPRALRELARDAITGQAIITDQRHVIDSAFYMILVFVNLGREVEKVGAIYGYMKDTVPGRGMNGYPIFTACGFIHVNDMPKLREHLAQMEAALA